MGRAEWLLLFGSVLVAWALLWVISAPSAISGIGALKYIRALCSTASADSKFLTLWAMWSLMALAMMLPTALPAFATFDDLSSSGAEGAGRSGFLSLVAGYATIWLAASAVGAAVQLYLGRLGADAGLTGGHLSRVASGLILIAAGAYQLTPLKAACVSRCRMPLTFFMERWSEGPFRMGLRLGADCLGCCWALMALALVGGLMSLGFMALSMVLMTLEKLPVFGPAVTYSLAAALMVSGAAVIIF